MQASTETTRSFGGSGLGLSIAKNLVELQGGKIDVKSEDGKGSTFSFWLDYEIKREDIKIESLSGEDNIKKLKFDQNVKVLLCEDNRMNQVLAKEVLKRFGCTTDIAENGSIALEMMRNGVYDIVLMDIQMPIMDGYEASKSIRNELNLQVPIIAMTAHVMPNEKEKCIGYGMNDYISKPFKVENLYHIIEQFVLKAA